MSDEKSPWQKVIGEISHPLDWVFMGIGATGGAVVTGLLHGTDLGTSVAGGAIAGITARKALALGLRGRTLRKRAQGLLKLLKQKASAATDKKQQDIARLIQRTEQELTLFNEKTTSAEQFAEQLDKIVDRYRKF